MNGKVFLLCLLYFSSKCVAFSDTASLKNIGWVTIFLLHLLTRKYLAKMVLCHYSSLYTALLCVCHEFYQCVRLPNGPLIFLSTTLLNVLEKHWYSKGSPLQLSNSTSGAPCCGSRLQIMSVTLFWTSSRFLWPLLLSVAETIKNLSEFGYL